MTKDDFIDVIISMKKARMKAARGFSLNSQMYVECTLLDAEIKNLNEQKKEG